MSNQPNNPTQVDENVQDSQEQPKQQRPRRPHGKRAGSKISFASQAFSLKLDLQNLLGSDRKNQDLGEDENRGSNDDDTQRSNQSDNENQTNARGSCLERLQVMLMSCLPSYRWPWSTRWFPTWSWLVYFFI